MNRMSYSLNKQLTGAATRGQKIMVRQLLATEEGMSRYLDSLSKAEASTIIETVRGRV